MKYAYFDVATLLGKRVRIWRDKTRGTGRAVEGVVDYVKDGIASFPSGDGYGAWVIRAANPTRVLDVFEDGVWKPVLPVEKKA